MAKKDTATDASSPDLVKVELRCTYSGFEGDPAPGSIIEVDAEEAARLIELGSAVAYSAPVDPPVT